MDVETQDETASILHSQQSKSIIKTHKASIVFGIIIFVASCAILGVFIALVYAFRTPTTDLRMIKFNDIFDNPLAPKGYPSIQWAKTGSSFTSWRNVVNPATNQTECELSRYNPATNTFTTLLNKQTLDSANVKCGTSYIFSQDDSLVALLTDVKDMFRHSVVGQYMIYDFTSGQFTSLAGLATFNNANWCPTNKNILALVKTDNNIYLESFEAGNRFSRQITFNGEAGAIFNGFPDWLYEEEIFGDTSGLWWSSDCSLLSFVRLNDTFVDTYRFTVFEADKPYDAETRIKYPKPGFSNPTVSMHVYSIASEATTELLIGGEETDLSKIYVYDVQWKPASNKLGVVRLGRIQNKKELLMFDITTPPTTPQLTPYNTIVVQQSNTWIHNSRTLFFLDTAEEPGRYFVDILPYPDNFHIGLFDETTGSLVRMLTSGDWDVLELVPVFNKEQNVLYYLSTEDSSVEKHLYKVNINGEENEGKERLTDPNGYYSVSFDAAANFYLEMYQGPEVPRYSMRSTANSSTVVVLEDNKALNETITTQFALPTYEFTTVKAADGVTDLNVMVIFPPFFSLNNRHPVLFHVYGGPASQQVRKTYSTVTNVWHLYVATTLNTVVVVVDPRGTNAKGYNFMTTTYGQLGVKESQDVRYAARQVATWSFVDYSRMALWGWSYGGYMTLLSNVLKKYDNYSLPIFIHETFSEHSRLEDLQESGVLEDPFHAAVSVAPVTDWRYYDSGYTERYMGLPDSNAAGYDAGSVCVNLNPYSFNRTALLLIHGTGDDNVHAMNSFVLMEKMVENEIKFDVMFYTNKAHSLSGLHTQRHLYSKIGTHLRSAFKTQLSYDTLDPSAN